MVRADQVSAGLFPPPPLPKKDPNEGTFTLSSYLRTVFNQFDVRVAPSPLLSFFAFYISRTR